MTSAPKDPFDAQALAAEAYAYLYPLVTMEITRRQMTNAAPGAVPGRGPMNAFTHIRAFPTAEFRAVVRPNFDTLYTLAWLDLSRGPIVVSTPDTGGRYFAVSIYDMWSNAFAAPGWRTSGTRASAWALTPPGWTGDIPEGVQGISSPSPTVWIIVRTQTNGPADYPAVHHIQDGMSITPLTRWGMPAEPVPAPIDPTVDVSTEPLRQVNALNVEDFFTLGAELMAIHPPAVTDWSLLARVAHIGVAPGRPFRLDGLPASDRAAVEAVPGQAVAHLMARMPTLARVVNGWSMNTETMGVYGNSYVKRAVVAMVGLGANSPEDAIYPLQVVDANGEPASGDRRYALHFGADALPPVDAFWSVTLYDQEGYQVANPVNRYALGDRDPLVPNADGSVDLHVQHDEPADNAANWLPAPTGPYSLCMRLYAPRAEALDGRWNPPALTRVS